MSTFKISAKYYPSFRTCMDSKFTIFVAVGSLLVMAISIEIELTLDILSNTGIM